MRPSRRQFLATAAAAAAPLILTRGASGESAPSSRINLACIGIRSMGNGNMNAAMSHSDCRVAAVCDVDEEYLERRRNEVNARYENEDCKAFTDYHELLEMDGLDAVMIATPDHWHAPIAIAAARKGLDIYCEKPITHTHAEGKKLVSVVEEEGVVWQTGSQQRSEYRFRRPVEIVRNGLLGDVQEAEVGLPSGNPFPPDPGDFDPPGHVDYDQWCGPSPVLPYHPGRFHGSWRWHYHYGGGQLQDWIGHHNDILHWMLDMDGSGPTEVEIAQFDQPQDQEVWNAAWRYEGFCRYPNGVRTRITNRARQGVTVYGTEGWLHVSRSGYAMSRPEWYDRDFDPGPEKVYESNNHWRNFLDCVKSREPAIAPAEAAHRATTPGHLMLIAAHLGQRLVWEPDTEQIIDNEEASKLLAQQGDVMPWMPWRTDWCEDYLNEDA